MADPDPQSDKGGGRPGHPDPEIRGVGLKKNFSALRASVWSNNEGGPPPPPRLLDPTPLKPHIFLESCGRGLKPVWRVVSQQCGFGVQIHWFRVDGGTIRVKMYAVLKKIGICVNIA